MKADEGGPNAAERNREHMAQVRAIHRRSAYERVTRKIERFEELQRAADVGFAGISVEHCRAELGGLHELRELLWREMVEAGQVAPSADE